MCLPSRRDVAINVLLQENQCYTALEQNTEDRQIRLKNLSQRVNSAFKKNNQKKIRNPFFDSHWQANLLRTQP